MADVRLIDANALKEDLKNMLARVIHESDLDFDHSHAKIWTAAITGIQHSIKRLDNAPTIDAVEVVRCRECKYLIAPKLCSNPMACGWDALEPNDDDFCSRGEKKDGGADNV